MDIRHLRYFISIVDSGSLSEASRRLHIVQPALSQRLSDLEEELGAQLLVRGRSGVAVTEAGAELYIRAKHIVKQLGLVRDAVQEKAGAAHGKVSIGLLRTVAPILAGRLFSAIKYELPDVVPEIVVGYSAELMGHLRSMRLDMAMQVRQPLEKSREGIHLFSESLSLVSHPDIFKANGPVKIRDLATIPLLLSSLQPLYSSLIDEARDSKVNLSIVGGIEDTASVLEVCRAGLACTILPQFSAERIDPSLGLSATTIDSPSLHREIRLVSHAGLPKTGAMMAVEEILIRIISESMGGT